MPTIFEQPATKTKKPVASAKTTKPSSHSKMTPLTAFAVAPDGVRFETQEVQEEVVLFLRQHPIVLLPPIVLVVGLVLAPTVFFPFFFRFVQLPFPLHPGYLIVGTLFWYVFTFGFILVSFLRWFFNIYIVTNERIIDIDFVHLLYKEFSEARLGNVQDMTYKRAGIFASLFDYGHVFVQTAGTMPNFEFLAVPHPGRVVEMISELVEQAKKGT